MRILEFRSVDIRKRCQAHSLSTNVSRTESPVAAKAVVDLVVVLVVDVDVDEKLSNAGSQVPLTIRILANIFVHVHDHVHDDVHVHVRGNLCKGSERFPVRRGGRETPAFPAMNSSGLYGL
jgi:hypothetical protein